MVRKYLLAAVMGAAFFCYTASSALAQSSGHASVGLGHGEEGYLHLEEMIKHLEFGVNMPDASPEMKKHAQAALKKAQEALKHYDEALKHASEALGRPARNPMQGEGSGHQHDEGSGAKPDKQPRSQKQPEGSSHEGSRH